MTLSLGLSSHAHARNAQQQQEIKEARRVLKDRVRNDWDYPPLPAYRQASPTTSAPLGQDRDDRGVLEVEEKIAGFRFYPSNVDPETPDAGPFSVAEEPLEWREREYSSESSADDEDEQAGGQRRTDDEKYQPMNDKSPVRNSKTSPSWRFDNPDSVGAQILDRKTARKRKRDLATSDEMTWNEGLAHWLARRDEWCGTQTAEQVQAREASHHDEDNSSYSLSSSSGTETSPTRLQERETSSPRSSTSTAAKDSGSSAPEESHSSPSTTPEPTGTSTWTLHPPPSKPTTETKSWAPLLIPVAQPLLPNHPVRRRITPAIYPEIYSKIIVQGRTPSVPINLAVLNRALVQGWKDDGEWPPKPGPLERAIGRKKGGGGGEMGALRTGVRAVGRALRITSGGADSGVVADKA